MDKITDGLYLGDILAASNFPKLKEHGVTHVLQVIAGMNPCFPKEFKYKAVNAMDVPWENLHRHFHSCN